MNKPHVHATLIKAKADGAVIQERVLNTINWLDMADDDWGFCVTCEYRIKPEREWPVTSLSPTRLRGIYFSANDDHDLALKLVADMAIEQYIKDSEK